MTIDKIQGLGFKKVAVMFDTYSQRLQTSTKYYTALSRAEQDLKIYFHKDEIKENILDNQPVNNNLFKLKNCSEVLEGISTFTGSNPQKFSNDLSQI